MMENMSNKFIGIIVNGRIKPFLKNVKCVTYETLIELAFGSYEEHPNRCFTVTYSKGKNNSSGSVVKEDKISIIEGMVFNVTATDMA